ncbi:hypothetical protein ACF05T_22350 [Streptomyces lateritius]|uniref:Uncharacterized protein n=1 Tax=Streptomyces lateritius TaxID=67313 RepID=A0ABW6YG58_9ACTN
MARAQGLFQVVGGAWPLVSCRTLARGYGPVSDEWPQRTGGDLLLSDGCGVLRAASEEDGVRHARRVGVGTALTFLAVDLVRVPRGRIRATYLMDAAKESARLAAWWRVGRLDGRAAQRRGL